MTEGQDAVRAQTPWEGVGGAVSALPIPTALGATLSGTPAPAGGAVTVVPAGTGADTGPSGHGGPGTTGEQSGHGWPGEAPAQPGRSRSGSGGAQSGVGWPTGAAQSAGSAAGGKAPPGADEPHGRAPSAGLGEEVEPYVRVDARRLEAALLGLRHPIVTVPLLLEVPGVAEARAERHKLLSQIDDYLLPRLRQSGAPILVALVGSTGAGKSTLVNTIVGKQVSATGIRRPTTNSPVLACHPNDIGWFAENVFLPTLPRVRQQGLAMPGRDGLLVLAACEGMPEGVALLDTPDIDSVVEAHHEFAHQFLDASDLWLFVTTARRYADAAVWEMLKDARDRGAALAVTLSRVPPGAAPQLSAHFDAMLEANGLSDVRRFIIPETVITEARLPERLAEPVKQWLADTAKREDRRVAVLTQTMSGVLDTFRNRVPALAEQVTAQLAVRHELRDLAGEAYDLSLTEFDEATRNGSLLSGEVLARWQDFAGTGDLLRALQVRRRAGQAAKSRNQRLPASAGALKAALRAGLESLVFAVADRAAERAVSSWQRHPTGAAVLAELGAGPHLRRDGTAESSEADYLASALADLGLDSGANAASEPIDPESLARAGSGLSVVASRAISNWQEHVLQLVGAEKVTKRSIARVVSFDDESLALVLSIAVVGYAADGLDGDAARTVPHELLTTLFGPGLLREMRARVLSDLHDRVSLLLEEDAQRFGTVLDSFEAPDETAPTDLLQAGYILESAR
jgi:hypothetical protein